MAKECKIPNKGRGFFVEAKTKKEAMRKGRERNKRIHDKSKVTNATKVDRKCASAFKSPYFVWTKRQNGKK